MPGLSFKQLWKYGVLSGILIGLICLIPLIGGWDNYIKQPDYKLSPLQRLMSSLFFWVIQGVFMCWLLSRFAFSGKQSNTKYKKTVIFLMGSCLTTIAIQLAARDALIFNSELMEAGKGGPLGQPSFETIGNFFAAGCIYLGIYILFVNSSKLKSFFKTNYLSTLTLACMSYGVVFLTCYSITNGKKVPENWGVKKYIFEWSFPHEERIFLLPLMISILFIVYYFGIRREREKMNRREFDIAISYSSKDADFTDKLVDRLKENKISVYKYRDYLHETVGQIFTDEYLQEVYKNRSKYQLIIVSKNYLTSPYTPVELGYIKGNQAESGGIILLIIIDDTKLSELGLSDDIVYLDSRQLSIVEIAKIIITRVTRPVDRV